MNGYVYLTTNLVNNKKYVGSHKGPVDDTYIGSGVILARATTKYGIRNFRKEVLEIVPDIDDLLIREDYWLDKLECAKKADFYNISPKAGGGNMCAAKSPYEIRQIVKRQKLTRNNRSLRKKALSIKKMLLTRENWTPEQKQLYKNRRAIASKLMYQNMPEYKKVARIRKINKTKSNLPETIKKQRSATRSKMTAERWGKYTDEQKAAIFEKIKEKNRQYRKNLSVEQKRDIAKRTAQSVSQYYAQLPEKIKRERSAKISNKVKTLIWINDGVRSYRVHKMDNRLTDGNYKLGRIKEKKNDIK